MTGPYRDTGGDATAEAPRDAGIVGDVIAQFADPHAYLRELVQNSIDAGSPSVEVELPTTPTDQLLTVAVRDRGEGMTRDIIENQLLVLFRSTKEKDDTKIGKFGIGFASVLSPNPEVVSVHTARDQRRLTLHLYRDLSYELFDAGPATQNGTTVELEIAMPPDEVTAYCAACEPRSAAGAAMHRCRSRSSRCGRIRRSRRGSIARWRSMTRSSRSRATTDDGQLRRRRRRSRGRGAVRRVLQPRPHAVRDSASRSRRQGDRGQDPGLAARSHDQPR